MLFYEELAQLCRKPCPRPRLLVDVTGDLLLLWLAVDGIKTLFRNACSNAVIFRRLLWVSVRPCAWADIFVIGAGQVLRRRKVPGRWPQAARSRFMEVVRNHAWCCLSTAGIAEQSAGCATGAWSGLAPSGQANWWVPIR